jgi:hypothetical protein
VRTPRLINYNTILKLAPAILLCWCFFSFTGCKDPSIEDNDLLTDDDNLSLDKDTLYFNTRTVRENPLKSNNVATVTLGHIDDPAFGKTATSFYAQCRLSKNNVSFGANPLLDSVVLSLKYSGKYGKFDQPINLVVYQLNQNIDTLNYNLNDAFQVKLPTIGQLTNYVPNLTDSVVVVGVKKAPQLRIPLTTSFGNQILQSDTLNLVNNTAFLELFKGLYVTVSSNSGNGLVYLDLKSAISGITLFYRNDTEDSLQLFIPTSGISVNHIDNNYTGSPAQSALSTTTAQPGVNSFVQGGAGTYARLEIVDLDSFPKNIAINKAELILTQSTDTSYLAPLLLDLFRVSDFDGPVSLEDEGLSHYGGVRQVENVNGVSLTRYRFNIKKYFQKLINGTHNNKGFFLKTLTPNTNSERVVIANSLTDPNFKIVLIVTYTKL